MTSIRGAAVIDGLVTLASDLFEGEGVRVVDGPAPQKVSGKKLLMIGWDPNSPIHVIARREESSLDADPTEVGEVACYIAWADGGKDMKVARDGAVDILTRLDVAIREDQAGLGGACDLAELGPDAGIWQYQTGEDGATVGIPFSVRYEAYL